MKILAIDTSALTASVAVLEDETLKGEITFTTALTHSETIMPMIDKLLEGVCMKPSDIDIFACSNGPGSFTGLRIGIGTIKGLSYGADKKAVGVSTLLALAYNVPYPDFLICPIMDARRGQVYNALYRYENGSMVCEKEPRALSLDELLSTLNEKTIFVGDGVARYRTAITEKMGDNAFFAPPNLCLGHASSVALAAMHEKALDASSLTAVYLRKPQAEREREEKLNIKD